MSEPKHTLSYRPDEFDDWGDIRNQDGTLVAKVALHAMGYQSEDDLAKHRQDKTDPCKELGEYIVRACNSHSDLLEALKELVDACDGNYAELVDVARAAIAKAQSEEFSRPGIQGVYAGNYDPSKFPDVIKLTPKGGDTTCHCSPNEAVSNAPETVQSPSDAQKAIERIATHLSFNGTAIELAEMIEGFQVKHVNY